MPRRLSPARFVALVSSLLALYSLARVAVLFFEALSVVRSSRQEDEELLLLCVAGQARGSAKMRDACLKARAELASPIVFKAIVQAVSTAFKDFTDAVGSPFKMLCVVLFMLGSVVLPVMPWARMLIGQPVADPHEGNGVHYISYAPPIEREGRFRRRVRGAMKKLRMRGSGSSPRIEEMYDDDGDLYAESDLEPGSRGMSCSSLLSSASEGHVAVPMGGWEEVPIGNAIPAPASLHTKWD